MFIHYHMLQPLFITECKWSCGKVMILHLSVSHSVHMGGMHGGCEHCRGHVWWEVCIAGGMHGRGSGHVWWQGHAWQREGACVVVGVCMAGGMHDRGREHVWRWGHTWLGACIAGACVMGACMAGGMCGRGACVAGGMHSEGYACRRDGHWSGQYTSYINAFLLI